MLDVRMGVSVRVRLSAAPGVLLLLFSVPRACGSAHRTPIKAQPTHNHPDALLAGTLWLCS